jgi:maleate isomerase
MPDTLAPRGKFGVLAPSTNTSVQPEFDAMRPWGVTHHHSRLVIPDSKVSDDASFLMMMDNIRAALFPALEAVLTCDPDYVILGMSSETFWDGIKGSRKLEKKLRRIAKRGVAMGSDACREALRAYGRDIKRLGVVTPYMPVGDRQVVRFFSECGYRVVNLHGFKCRSPTAIAAGRLRPAREVPGPPDDAASSGLSVVVATARPCSPIARTRPRAARLPCASPARRPARRTCR